MVGIQLLEVGTERKDAPEKPAMSLVFHPVLALEAGAEEGLGDRSQPEVGLEPGPDLDDGGEGVGLEAVVIRNRMAPADAALLMIAGDSKFGPIYPKFSPLGQRDILGLLIV